MFCITVLSPPHPAALLAASTRALQPGPIEQVVDAVTRELAPDMGDTGRFVPLRLEIDPPAGGLRRVRAGHDPAVRYDPSSGPVEVEETPRWSWSSGCRRR
jgi:sigma-B regulation protein RsbU (phosphoserine phosphatase)